jgi:hypothetical protein
MQPIFRRNAAPAEFTDLLALGGLSQRVEISGPFSAAAMAASRRPPRTLQLFEQVSLPAQKAWLRSALQREAHWKTLTKKSPV